MSFTFFSCDVELQKGLADARYPIDLSDIQWCGAQLAVHQHVGALDLSFTVGPRNPVEPSSGFPAKQEFGEPKLQTQEFEWKVEGSFVFGGFLLSAVSVPEWDLG